MPHCNSITATKLGIVSAHSFTISIYLFIYLFIEVETKVYIVSIYRLTSTTMGTTVKISLIWKHSTNNDDTSGCSAKCIECNAVRKHKNNTSNLIHHLKKDPKRYDDYNFTNNYITTLSC